MNTHIPNDIVKTQDIPWFSHFSEEKFRDWVSENAVGQRVIRVAPYDYDTVRAELNLMIENNGLDWTVRARPRLSRKHPDYKKFGYTRKPNGEYIKLDHATHVDFYVDYWKAAKNSVARDYAVALEEQEDEDFDESYLYDELPDEAAPNNYTISANEICDLRARFWLIEVSNNTNDIIHELQQVRDIIDNVLTNYGKR